MGQLVAHFLVYPGDVLSPGSSASFLLGQELCRDPAGHGKPICLQLSPGLGWRKGRVKGEEFGSAKNSGRATPAVLPLSETPQHPGAGAAFAASCLSGRRAWISGGEPRGHGEGRAHSISPFPPSPALFSAGLGDSPSCPPTSNRPL